VKILAVPHNRRTQTQRRDPDISLPRVDLSDE
jgi:hypothetical protein